MQDDWGTLARVPSVPSVSSTSPSAVAILSTATRLPSEVFLSDHIDLVPSNRWDIDRYALGGVAPVRFASCMPGVEEFDSMAFSISQQEASLIDPQSRILLEATYEALQASEWNGNSITLRDYGVAVGTYQVEYGPTSASLLSMNAYTVTNMVTCPQAGRISYVFGMKGMCLAVDTACSSALVAASVMQNGILRGQIAKGLVGSVNLVMPIMHLACTMASMLAADGRSKTLDASADGYARGEACAVHILDGVFEDNMASGPVAFLLGTFVNQDGRSSSLTAPNGPSQQSLLRAAFAASDLEPCDVTHLELHGTGE